MNTIGGVVMIYRFTTSLIVVMAVSGDRELCVTTHIFCLIIVGR